MSLRLVMLGTGRFALPTFRALCESVHNVVGLVTQPDRLGRGHHRHRNPMKDLAQEQGLPVFQPGNANEETALNELRTWNADLFVVAAYGQILSKALLKIPPLGAINVHASLLPKYRGAAPIQYAILNGERETGVTIFQIEPALDAGPILASERTEIGPKETSGDLELRLADLAAPLTVRVVDAIAQGTIQQIPQDPLLATRAPRLKKEDGQIDWSQPAERVCCHVRAMFPWPKPYTFLKTGHCSEQRLVILDAEVAPEGFCGMIAETHQTPGTVLFADASRLIVQAGSGAVDILRVQPDGKRGMAIGDFLCGHAVSPGDVFISPVAAHS